MSLIRYEPWSLVRRMRRDLDQLLAADRDRTADARWLPAVDIREEADRYVVRADLPGVDPKDIEITSENGVLEVRGERNLERRESGEGYRRVERVSGRFQRRFTLPREIAVDQIEARSSNGVLEVSLPKLAEAQPRKVTVEAA